MSALPAAAQTLKGKRLVTRVPGYPVPVPIQPPPTRSGARFQISRWGCNSSVHIMSLQVQVITTYYGYYKQIDGTLTCQAHRSRVHDVKLHPPPLPPPPVKADSDHMCEGPPQRSFRTRQTRTNKKQNSAFRPAEVSIRRRLQVASIGANPLQVFFPSRATEQYL